MGTFHAYHALQDGKKVLLLEKDNYPVSATVRNFGQIVPSGMTGRWFDFGVTALDIYKSLQQQTDISVRENGTIYIASDVDEVQLIHELKSHYDTLGYEAEILSKKEISKRYPSIRSSYAKEAILFPQEISVEPNLMIFRLQAFMQEKFPSFSLLYNNPVLACSSGNDGASVTTSNGSCYLASSVIICNGYEFKLLYPDLFRDSGLIISKLQMMRTLPMPDVKLPGNILTGLTIRRYESFGEYCPSFKNISIPGHYSELMKWGIHILFKQAPDGSIIIGDSHEYADLNRFDDLGFSINNYINELMIREAERIVDFDLRNMATTWAGFYPQHNEKHIFEHDVDEYIHIRTGIGGKGMTAGAGYAKDSIDRLFG